MENEGGQRSHANREWDANAEETPPEAAAAAIENRVKDQSTRLREGLARFNCGSHSSEEQDDEEFASAVAEVIDLTTETPDEQPLSKEKPIRSPSLPVDILLDHYDLGGIKLEPELTVEIQTLDHAQLFKSSFLWIKHIIDTPRGIKLHGVPLTRARNMRGRLPSYRNEVVMILHVDSDDKRDEKTQAAIDIPIADVVKIRNCHFTNADFPRHRTVLGIYSTTAEVEQYGVLMCRWKCIFKYRDAATRIAYLDTAEKNAAPLEYSVEHLNGNDKSIKRRFMVSESGRFNIWRGGKVRGGEHDPDNENSPVKGLVVHIDSREELEMLSIPKRPGQRYTFGDMFCGAGGASCGARKAGFQIKVACDNHAGACNTYAKVYPEAQLHRMNMFELIARENLKIRVDVLNLSPPCQFWSPAHTVAGVNDDANIAALFACRELVKKFRPRLFTLEQTYGILHQKFEYYFNSLIHGFTDHNYSVRWKVVNLVNWGAPATRRRLIMIGSCPGEDLPPFPEATHVANGSKRRGKRPYVTVKEMLARIPRDASQRDDMHQPHGMVRKGLERWDPDVTLTRCITTNGGVGNYHPNGRRDFTLREYATLQTFPVDYPFQTPDRKRQIGNAFPPMAVKVLYTHLRKWLEAKDRVYAIENEPLDRDDPNVEYVDLDDYYLDATNDGEDVEYVASQQRSNPSSDSTNSYQDKMDLDAGPSDGEYGHVQCVDPNQRRRDWPTLGLRNRTGGITQDYVDLTGIDD
ncbi:S-adenosyl-L-methionine-dependent methyltransferase [Xylaria sp. FL0933]|nr:S-adenosyl-L-methionine-dependent methyltransferase [Xylaria sp. FL0933]